MDGSLQTMAELINFDFTGESRNEHDSIDTNNWWLMFANVAESTCIYMVINDPHHDQYKTFEE